MTKGRKVKKTAGKSDKSKTGNPPPKKGKRSFRKYLWGALAFFLVVLLSLSALAFALFAPWQEVPVVVPSLGDLVTCYRLSQQFSRSLKTRNGVLPEKAAIRLSPDEVNKLFRAAANITPKDSPYPIRYYRPHLFENGEFSMVYPVDTGMRFIRGGVIYIKFVFTLSKSPGSELKCKVISLKATSLSLSPSIAQEALENIMQRKKVQDDLNRINALLHSISFSNGKLRIEYDPRRLQEFYK